MKSAYENLSDLLRTTENQQVLRFIERRIKIFVDALEGKDERRNLFSHISY